MTVTGRLNPAAPAVTREAEGTGDDQTRTTGQPKPKSWDEASRGTPTAAVAAAVAVLHHQRRGGGV